MMSIIFWTWCFPQTLIGFLIYQFLKLRKKDSDFVYFKEAIVLIFPCLQNSFFSGGSFGKYIILPVRNLQTVKHEYGHLRQGLIFGPLYLFVVGIPSVFWNLLSRVLPHIKKTYYIRYPENWADKLGGVER